MALKKTKRRPLRNALGLQIRRLREEKNWSQSDFARELQLSGWDVERSIITKIELRRRCITDYELLLMLKTLGATLSSIKTPKAGDLSAWFL
jgi:transcriptional regulator with XRE-family HTH domain